MSEDTPSPENYRQLRECMNDLRMQLAEQIPRKALKAGRKKLELGRIDMSPEEADVAWVVLFDYCLFYYRKKGRTLLEQYFEDHPPAPDTPERQIQQSLDSYRYTLFEPLGVGDNAAAVPSFDQLQGIGFTMMDEGLAGSVAADQSTAMPIPSPSIMAAGLLWLPEFAMATSTVLPVSPAALDRIEQDLKKEFGPAEHVDFEALNRYEASDVAAIIIKNCLREGAAQHLTGS